MSPRDLRPAAQAQMELDYFHDILAHAEDIEVLDDRVTRAMRELTGARLAVLVECRHSAAEGHLLLHVNPVRRITTLRWAEVEALAMKAHDLLEPTLWRPDDASLGPVLDDIEPGPAMAVPLRRINESIGVLLLFGLPDLRGVEQVLISLGWLSRILSLGLSRAIADRRRQELLSKTLEERDDLLGRWENLIDAAPTAVVAVDLEGRVTEWNPGAERVFGWARDEVVGAVIPAVRAKDKVFFEGVIAAALEGERIREQEFQGRRKDGSKVWVRLSTSVLTDVEGRPTGLIGVLEDVSERRRVRLALEESEERFRVAFLTSPDSININRLEDGNYVEVSRGFTDITGFTRDDVRGRSSVELGIWVDPKDRERLASVLVEKGSCENLQARFRHKDGRLLIGLMAARILEIAGEPHILSVTKDITARIASEEDLRISKVRLEFFHSLDQAILQARSVSAVAEAIFGHLQGMVAADRISLAVFDEAFEEAVVFAEGVGAAEIGGGNRITVAEGFVNFERLKRGEVVQTSALDIPSGTAGALRGLRDAGIKSTVSLPIVAGETLLGCLNLARTEEEAFTEADIGVLGEVVDSLAVALEHERLNEKLKAHAETLEAEVDRRTLELRQAVNLMAGRENRMADLKEIIAVLERQIEEAGLKPAVTDATYRRR